MDYMLNKLQHLTQRDGADRKSNAILRKGHRSSKQEDLQLISKRWASKKVGTINNDIEVGLLELNWQKLCKQFCVHRLFDGTSILTEHVSRARVCQCLDVA